MPKEYEIITKVHFPDYRLHPTVGSFVVLSKGDTAYLFYPESLSLYHQLSYGGRGLECNDTTLFSLRMNHNAYYFASEANIKLKEKSTGGEVFIHDGLFTNMYIYKDEFVGVRMREAGSTEYIVQKEKRNRTEHFGTIYKFVDVEDVPSDAGGHLGLFKDYMLFYNGETNKMCAIHLRRAINAIEYWDVEFMGDSYHGKLDYLYGFCTNGADSFCYGRGRASRSSSSLYLYHLAIDVAKKVVKATEVSVTGVQEMEYPSLKNVGDTLFIYHKQFLYKLKPRRETKLLPPAGASSFHDLVVTFH